MNRSNNTSNSQQRQFCGTRTTKPSKCAFADVSNRDIIKADESANLNIFVLGKKAQKDMYLSKILQQKRCDHSEVDNIRKRARFDHTKYKHSKKSITCERDKARSTKIDSNSPLHIYTNTEYDNDYYDVEHEYFKYYLDQRYPDYELDSPRLFCDSPRSFCDSPISFSYSPRSFYDYDDYNDNHLISNFDKNGNVVPELVEMLGDNAEELKYVNEGCYYCGSLSAYCACNA